MGTLAKVCARCGRLKLLSEFRRWMPPDSSDDGTMCTECWNRSRSRGGGEIARARKRYLANEAHENCLTIKLSGVAWSVGRCECGYRGKLFDGEYYGCRQRGQPGFVKLCREVST